MYDRDKGQAPRLYLLEFIETSLEIPVMYSVLSYATESYVYLCHTAHYSQERLL